METKTFNVKGMHCASCSSLIEKQLKKLSGVDQVQANFATETARVSFDAKKINAEQMSSAIEPLGYSLHSETAAEMGMSESEHAAHLGLHQSKEDKQKEIKQQRSLILSLLPLAAFSIIVMAWDTLIAFKQVAPMPIALEEFIHHLLPILATYTLFVAGRPYLLGLYRFIRYGKANMDSLIGLGTMVAFLYSFIVTAFEDSLRPFINVEHNFYDVTIVVIAFISFGKYLEAKSKLKTGDAIEKLLKLQAKTAIVIRNGKEQEIAVSEVKHGDQIVVKPGGVIAVDGVISEGSSFVDESMVSGEAMPVEKNIGSNVIGATINTTGSFIFTATKVGSETVLAHIIQMVENAQGSRAPIQALADKISAIFVPAIVIISFITIAAWLILGTPLLGFSQALSYGLVCFVGILVIACPCALGLATPTAIIVGVGKGAREGILIKDAATLQKLHTVTAVVVDKTGTITKGRPELSDIENFSDHSNEELIALLAALETKSEHPLAHAILSYAKEHDIAIPQLSNFEALRGLGVRGRIDNKQYSAGSLKLAEDMGLKIDKEKIVSLAAEGKTPILLCDEKKVLALIMVADAIKNETKAAIKELHKQKIQVIMITGDTKTTAEAIAKQVGIDQVIAEALPEDKLKHIQELQRAGKIVAMAGDGINDAPALAQADVGIAMSTGTDIAIETAGITLLHGDISKLVKAIHLSRLTMRGIKQNLFWAFIYNIIGIPLAAGLFYPLFGWLLNPIFAGLAMAFSSVSVVGNSLRLKSKTL